MKEILIFHPFSISHIFKLIGFRIDDFTDFSYFFRQIELGFFFMDFKIGIQIRLQYKSLNECERKMSSLFFFSLAVK